MFANAVASEGSAGNLASSLTVEIWRQINSSDEDEASCSAVTEQSTLPEGGRTTSNTGRTVCSMIHCMKKSEGGQNFIMSKNLKIENWLTHQPIRSL